MDNYSITMKKELALEYGPEGEWKNFYSVTGKLIETTVRYLSSAIAAIDAHRWYKVVLSKSEQTAVPRTVVTRERERSFVITRARFNYFKNFSASILAASTASSRPYTSGHDRNFYPTTGIDVQIVTTRSYTHTRSITERTVKREGGGLFPKSAKSVQCPRGWWYAQQMTIFVFRRRTDEHIIWNYMYTRRRNSAPVTAFFPYIFIYFKAGYPAISEREEIYAAMAHYHAGLCAASVYNIRRNNINNSTTAGGVVVVVTEPSFAGLKKFFL